MVVTLTPSHSSWLLGNKPVCRLTCSTGCGLQWAKELLKRCLKPAVGGPTVPLLSCLGSATKDAAHVSVSP